MPTNQRAARPQDRLRTARPKTPRLLAQTYPLSIVIPVHNAVGYLERCLAAVAQNDLSFTEVILVDDSSRDRSVTLAKSFEKKMPLRLVSLQERSGPAGARNAGWREARFPWVLFLDADVILPEKSFHWIRESLDIYSHRSEVVGVLGVYSPALPSSGFFTNFKNLYTCYLYHTTDALSPFIHTPIFCIGRDLLKKVGGFDGRLARAEDFRLGIVLGSQGYRFVIDRSVQGVHLKTYTLASILREDRLRIADLWRIKLTPQQRLFYYQAHRWGRLFSLALPWLILAVTAASFQGSGLGFVALSLTVLFLALNFGFLRHCSRYRGVAFGFQAAAFLFLEMLWGGIWTAAALLGWRGAKSSVGPNFSPSR